MMPTQIAADVPSELPGGTAEVMRSATSVPSMGPASETAAASSACSAGAELARTCTP